MDGSQPLLYLVRISDYWESNRIGGKPELLFALLYTTRPSHPSRLLPGPHSPRPHPHSLAQLSIGVCPISRKLAKAASAWLLPALSRVMVLGCRGAVLRHLALALSQTANERIVRAFNRNNSVLSRPACSRHRPRRSDHLQ